MKKKIRFRLVYLTLPLTALLAAGGNPAADDDQPTIAKDSISVTASHQSAYRKIGKGYSTIEGWLPRIQFRVNGPIASGSQLYVEFSLPTNKQWLKFDCRTGEIKKGHWWETECGGDVPNEKFATFTGPVGLSIRLRNELAGTDLTLFTGKMKVGKYRPYGPTSSEVFYVDEDWRLPIGYIFLGPGRGGVGQYVHVGFWYRGNPPTTEAHLFYQGKEIAKSSVGGSCGPANDARNWTPTQAQWGFADCVFDGVYPGEAPERGEEPRFGLGKNPGNYEVKVLVVGHLGRSIKFTVGQDGSFDNGIASSNKLGSDRVIVPVQVTGNQEPFDKTAWKTGAFYGNPLKGFTAP